MVVGLLCAGLVGVTIGKGRRRSTGPSSGLAPAEKEAWLRSARTAAADGRRIASSLSDVPDDVALGALTDAELDTRIGELDLLGSQLTQVTCTAPTSMDVRVCRSVAVAATSLGDSFRSERDRRRGDGRVVARYALRCADFRDAVRDLSNHADLL